MNNDDNRIRRKKVSLNNGNNMPKLSQTYYNERLMHWWDPHGKLYPCEQCVSDKLGNRKCELTRREKE